MGNHGQYSASLIKRYTSPDGYPSVAYTPLGSNHPLVTAEVRPATGSNNGSESQSLETILATMWQSNEPLTIEGTLRVTRTFFQSLSGLYSGGNPYSLKVVVGSDYQTTTIDSITFPLLEKELQRKGVNLNKNVANLTVETPYGFLKIVRNGTGYRLEFSGRRNTSGALVPLILATARPDRNYVRRESLLIALQQMYGFYMNPKNTPQDGVTHRAA